MPVKSLPEFESLLQAARGALDEAQLCECHGVACGLLCRRPGSSNSDFMAFLSGLELIAKPDQVLSRSLEALVDATRSQLDDEQYRFEILQPDSNEALEERTLALAQWCTGFLAGFAAGGQVEECSEEVTEILSDIEQIARAEIEGAEDNEEEELAMTEIVEYLRVVCLTLREEFRPAEPADVLH